MKFEDLTNVIEKQGADLFKANLQQHIQPIASKIEESVESKAADFINILQSFLSILPMAVVYGLCEVKRKTVQNL